MLRSMWFKVPTLVGVVVAFLWLDGLTAVLVSGGIFLGGMALLLGLVMHPNVGLWARTLWRAPQRTNTMALTFDDGPDPEVTPEILAILAERKIRAAFFVVGARVREHPEIVARLHDEGHLVCNHSDTHPLSFHFRLWSALRHELEACNQAIASVLGREPTLFRSPQGFKNPALGDVLRELGMTAVGWQVRGLDAMGGDPLSIERRVLDKAQPGGVIMLHDGAGFGGSLDRTPTIEALPRIIDGLRSRGIEFVRLDELLEFEPYRDK